MTVVAAMVNMYTYMHMYVVHYICKLSLQIPYNDTQVHTLDQDHTDSLLAIQ